MEDKVKVMMLVTKGDTGGAQKYVTDIRDGLDKERFKLVVASGKEGGELRAEIKLKWLDNQHCF